VYERVPAAKAAQKGAIRRLLQQRYGYSKERAQEDYDRFMRDQETEVRR